MPDIGAEPVDAYAAMRTYLEGLGLGDLSEFAISRIRQGASPEVIDFELRQQPQWKQRFAVIAKRQELKLPPISPAEVVAYEKAAREMAQAYGMPKELIGRQQTDALLIGDVSVSELESRFKTAYTRLSRADPATQETMRRLYGLGVTAGDIAAFALAPEVALPDIERRVSSIEVGAAGDQQGFNLSRPFIEQLVQQGVNANAAKQVFGTLARNRGLTEQLAGELSSALTTEEATQGLLGTSGEAAAKVERRRSALQAEFAGGGAAAQTSQEGVIGLR